MIKSIEWRLIDWKTSLSPKGSLTQEAQELKEGEYWMKDVQEVVSFERVKVPPKKDLRWLQNNGYEEIRRWRPLAGKEEIRKALEEGRKACVFVAHRWLND